MSENLRFAAPAGCQVGNDPVNVALEWLEKGDTKYFVRFRGRKAKKLSRRLIHSAKARYISNKTQRGPE